MMLEKSYRCLSLLLSWVFSSKRRRRSSSTDAVDPQPLRDHRRHHAEEVGVALEVPLLREGEVHRQGAGGLLAEDDGNADEGQLRARLPALAVQEERLAADHRDHDGPAALHHAAGDAFAHPVAGALTLVGDAEGRLDVDLPRVRVEQRHRAAQNLMMRLELLQHSQQCLLEIRRTRERLADLEQGGELADLALLFDGPLHRIPLVPAPGETRKPFGQNCRVVVGFRQSCWSPAAVTTPCRSALRRPPTRRR